MNKIALVLAASEGIGFSIAIKLLEIGNLVAFLCSNQANFLTGTSINVDGGVTMLI